MKAKTTLKDMSKILGCSISTISKALNDSPEISKKTKSRVCDVANAHNYTPNIIASSLKNGNSKILSISIPNDKKNICEWLLVELFNQTEIRHENRAVDNLDSQNMTSDIFEKEFRKRYKIVVLKYA